MRKILLAAIAVIALTFGFASPATAAKGPPVTATTYSYDVETLIETAPAVPTSYVADFEENQTRATGHFEATAEGLHIWTDGATSTDKVALYQHAGYGFEGLTSIDIDYTANVGIEPGTQLVVDINDDSIDDGILVGESVYGDMLWLSNSASAEFKALAPHVGGGYGSENYGTLAEWAAALPDPAVIRLVGFSLGSGVHGDGIVHSVNVSGLVYDFVNEVSGTPATYAWQTTGHVDGATSVPADTATTRYINVAPTKSTTLPNGKVKAGK